MMDEDELNESARVAPRTGVRYESRQIGLLIAGGVMAVVVVFALGILVGRYLMGGSASRNEAAPGQPPVPPVVKAVPKEEKPAPVPPPSLSQLPPAPPVALPALPPPPAPVEAKKPAERPAKAPSAEKAKEPETKEPRAAAKKEPDRFTFYRTLTAKKESEKRVDLKPAKKEKVPAKKIAKADPEKTAAKKPEKSEEAAGKVKEKAAKAPAKDESAAAAPKPAAKRYVVQVGSYRQESDAEKVAGELRDKGYQATVTSVDLADKGKWYRVRVGSPAAKEEAEIRAKEFEEKEKKKAAVLSE
jgi:cell division protein FtsN